jgi:flagellar protein FliS
MSIHPALSYQQAAARGASPLGQVVSLYDTILRDFHRALAALKTGNVEARVFELNHAITVIAHLQNVLDHERGGEAAKQFEKLYNITRAMIVTANARATPEALEELIEMYGGLRQAWFEAEQKISMDQIAPSAPPLGEADRTHAASPLNVDVETPRRHWST